MVAFDGPADELGFSTFQTQHGFSTVQRGGDGKVELFLPEAIAIHDKNTWTLKPYSWKMIWPILQMPLSPALPDLLDLAVHVLSPSKVRS